MDKRATKADLLATIERLETEREAERADPQQEIKAVTAARDEAVEELTQRGVALDTTRAEVNRLRASGYRLSTAIDNLSSALKGFWAAEQDMSDVLTETVPKSEHAFNFDRDSGHWQHHTR
jgi:chromosome segregation ATPase